VDGPSAKSVLLLEEEEEGQRRGEEKQLLGCTLRGRA